MDYEGVVGMKRKIRIFAFALAMSLLWSGVALAGSGVKKGALHLSAGMRTEMEALRGMIGSGLAVNGIIGAQLLTTGREGAGPALISFSLAPTPGQLSTYRMEGRTNPYSNAHPVLIATNPAGAAYKLLSIESSDPSVLRVDQADYTYNGVAGYPFLVALKKGTATVTVTMEGGKVSTKQISVTNGKIGITSLALYAYDAASDSLTLLPKKKAIRTDESLWIVPVGNPSSATYGSLGPGSYYAWKCASNNSAVALPVASLGYAARIYPGKPGSATISFKSTDGGKASASLKLSVTEVRAQSVSLDPIDLQPGATRPMSVAIKPDTAYNQSLTWSSSNKKVATVDSKGNVTGVSSGSCVIACKNKSSGKSASAGATVTYARDETQYFFYSIANAECINNAGDIVGEPLYIHNSILMSQTYAEAGQANYASKNENLNAEGIRGVLEDMANNPAIGEKDITVFYYTGWTRIMPSKEGRGALVGRDGQVVTVDEVRSYLDQVPGTVIVLLDCALSGQFIQSKGASPAQRVAQARAFNQAWISGLTAARRPAVSGKALTASSVRSKYKILASCQPLEGSWPAANGDFGRFTFWLCKGFGMNPVLNSTTFSGSLPADGNGDGVVTLADAYRYVAAGVASESDPRYWQTPAVWPANDPTALVNANIL
jgi:hypothetical protein